MNKKFVYQVGNNKKVSRLESGATNRLHVYKSYSPD